MAIKAWLDFSLIGKKKTTWKKKWQKNACELHTGRKREKMMNGKITACTCHHHETGKAETWMFAVAQLLRPTSKLLSNSKYKKKKKRYPTFRFGSTDLVVAVEHLIGIDFKVTELHFLWCVGLWFPFNHVQTTLMNYNYNLKKKRTDKIKWMIKHTTFNFSIKMFIWFLVHILFVRCTRLFLLFRIFYELILFFMVEIIFLLCWCS